MDILSNLLRLRWTPGSLGMRTTYYLPDGRHMSIVKLKALYNFTDKDQYETLMSDSYEERRHDSLKDIADYIGIITKSIIS